MAKLQKRMATDIIKMWNVQAVEILYNSNTVEKPPPPIPLTSPNQCGSSKCWCLSIQSRIDQVTNNQNRSVFH